MGGKGSKTKISRSDLARLKQSMSREDLACYLATISDMAHTGISADVPEIRVNDQPPESAGRTGSLPEMKQSLRHRLQKQINTNQDPLSAEQAQIQLELLDSLENQDDTSDWASMRSWLLWCLQSNLSEDLEDGDDMAPHSSYAHTTPTKTSQRRQSLTRQMAVTKGRLQLTRQGSASFDSNRSGQISGQNSFDSTGASADT